MAQPAPEVTVVIPMFNSAATISEQLEALTRQTYSGRWEVVVVDNGSVDDSVTRVEEFQGKLPGLRIVDASSARGASHARNAGAAAARGRYILYSDADDVVTPGWVAALTESLHEGGPAGGPMDETSLNEEHVREWGDPPLPNDRLNTVHGYLPNIRGTNFGISKEDLEAIGGWNEEYSFAEDVELSWRANNAGYELRFVPEAVVRYRRRNTLRTLARQQYGRARSNFRLLLLRDFAADGYQPSSDRSEARASIAWLVTTAPRALVSRKHLGLIVAKLAYGFGWARGTGERRRMRDSRD